MTTPTRAEEMHSERARSERRARLAAFAAVSAVALVARVLHVSTLIDTPFIEGPIIDALGHARDARQLVGSWVLEGGFYRPPLYSYLRAMLLAAGAVGPWPLLALHCVAGALTAGLVALVGYAIPQRISPRLRLPTMWMSGLMAAFYGPLIVYDAELLPSVWVNLLLAVAYALVLRSREVPDWVDGVAGVSLGLAVTGWPPSVLLALPLIALRAASVQASARLRVFVLVAAALAVPVSLSAAHNARHGALGIVISGNAGINLWLGNNPGWRDTLQAGPGLRYDLEYGRPTRAGVHAMAGREQHYLRMVGNELATRPIEAIGRTLRKLFYFIHGREVARGQDIGLVRDASWVARALLWERGLFFPFGVLLPLAIACPAFVIGRRRLCMLLGGAALYAAILSLFVLAARYRLPLVVLLIPLAATTVAWMLRKQRVPARSAIAAAIALVLCNVPVAYTRSFAATRAERKMLQASGELSRGAPEVALGLYTEALRLEPHNADAHVELGRALMSLGNGWEAAAEFRIAGQLMPESEVPWVHHGHAMLSLGRNRDAVFNFRQALARNPYEREALRALAMGCARLGDDACSADARRRYRAISGDE